MKLDDPHTLTRRDHGDTSHDAAAKVLGRTGSGRRRILTLLGYGPLTDDELAAWANLSPNTVRPRRVELVQLGYVKDSGERAVNAHGNRCVLWQITPAGVEALAP